MDNLEIRERIKSYIKDYGENYFRLANKHKVELCYKKIYKDVDISVQEILDKNKSLFLYNWFCVIDSLPDDFSPYIRLLKYVIDKESLHQYNSFLGDDKLYNMSYMNFTQMHIAEEKREFSIPVEYYFNACITLFHKCPISLLYILDNIPIKDNITEVEYMIYYTNYNAIVKHRPTLLEGDKILHRGPKNPICNSLIISSKYYSATIRRLTSNIEIKKEDIFPYIRDYYAKKVNAYIDYDAQIYHKFALVNRGKFYDDIHKYFTDNKISISTSTEKKLITISKEVYNYDITIEDRVLESSETYKVGDDRIYMAKGERILEIIIASDQKREDLISTVNRILVSIDYREDDDTYINNPQLSDITKLRASNNKVFNVEYSRYCPPKVQPKIIHKSEVQDYLKNQYMVLVYEGKYYTTKCSILEGGYCFIGFKQRFEKYNPNIKYYPIIRTYRTNHLMSNNYKEIKTYLLRNSPTGMQGTISPEDLLLPRMLEPLYRVIISNSYRYKKDVHSKKSKHILSINISEGDIPSIVGELFGIVGGIRRIIQAEGTKILDILNINKEEFKKLTLNYLDILDDLSGLNKQDIEYDIDTSNIDHRIYGKVIEYYMDTAIIVVDHHSVVPYRKSRTNAKKFTILFLTEDGTYDIIEYDEVDYIKVRSVLKLMNSQSNDSDIRIIEDRIRKVDYTLKYINITSAIYNMLEEVCIRDNLSYKISFVNVTIDESQEIAKKFYNKIIPYEGNVSKSIPFINFISANEKILPEGYSGNIYNYDDLINVTMYRDEIKVRFSMYTLLEMFPEILSIMGDTITFKGINYCKYHPHKMTLENALYDEQLAFNYTGKDEIYTYPLEDKHIS